MTEAAGQATHRIRGLDGLRGIAAVSVLLFHYTVVYERLVGPLGPPPIVAIYGQHGVELFFIISGFVILMTVENANGKLLHFIVSRFARLFPVFWVAVLAESLVLTLSPLPLNYGPPELSAIAANLTMMPVLFHARVIDNSYWSLFLELMFYVLLGAACQMRMVNKIEPLCFFWIIIFATVRFLHPDLGSRTRQILLVEYGHLFIVGICLYRIWVGRSTKLTFGLLALACGMSLFGQGEGGSTPTLLYFYITVGCTAVVWLAVAGKLPFLATRPLLFLGAISYPVYLLHLVIGFELIHFLLAAGASATTALVVATAGTLLFATAVTKLIEVPSRNWIRGLYAHYQSS